MDTSPLFFSRKDFLILSLLTAIYSAVALINLGSFDAPQTYWKPEKKGESFYADIGKLQIIDRVSYFLSFGAGGYRIDFSEDGRTWRDEQIIEQKNVYEMIEWRYFKPANPARYIRVTVDKPGAMLNEIGLYDSAKNLIPITTSSNAKVFDEQHTVAYVPSFFNSMYFDEIYHARTAYEYLHRMEPTEPTHPPLGKILISTGIAIFGMTPFGWRIAGTLFGIAMLPAIYCFARRLFGKSEYAFIAAFLFAFDFMHFTYTRIAVIDCFAVFFIIMMYYYMYRYFMMNFFSDGLWRTLVPLLLSGIFFGLGAATKWIAIFGAAGLAVILFIALGQRFCEYRKNREKQFFQYAGLTLGWCIVTFILIPGTIYLLSYIPFMLAPGPGHSIADVFRLQKYIYDYHSTMQITHPFSSQWWQWPIIYKPLWLYMGKDIPSGFISSIVAMGNPAVWWLGIPAIMTSLFIAIYKKHKGMLVILLAALSQYLPWALKPTDLTFIFHFFATIPFMILCIAYVIMTMINKFPKFKYVVAGYLVIVLALFAMFYPILSGAVISREYAATYLRWFQSWIFFV